jgi:hypothetical protein
VEEIQRQLDRIEEQIKSIQKVHATWTKYKECEMKTAVIHQSIGMIHGLEAAKESLEYIRDQQQPPNEQLTTDEWLIDHENRKRIMEQIDIRGGMINGYCMPGHAAADPLAAQYGYPGLKGAIAQLIDDGMAGRL